MSTDEHTMPPAARDLPPDALESAVHGAAALDAAAATPEGRNLLAHALVQLLRDGWLNTTGPDTVNKIRELRDLHGRDGTWDASGYLRGMYNGLELALSVLEGERTPQFRDPPADASGTEGAEHKTQPARIDYMTLPDDEFVVIISGWRGAPIDEDMQALAAERVGARAMLVFSEPIEVA